MEAIQNTIQNFIDLIFNPDINAMLGVIAQMMGTLNIPTQLGRNFLDFAEFSLTLLFFPIQFIGNLLAR